jgi:hypothetical protein
MAMAVARAHLPVERARSTVALLAVTASAGVGLGYPLTGLLIWWDGYRTAYWGERSWPCWRSRRSSRRRGSGTTARWTSSAAS